MGVDKFGDRMKEYEGIESDRRFLPLLPICARLDGKCFSKFTKGMKRPYDEDMIHLMKATTKFLVEQTNSNIGYTQSDEISLVFYSPDRNSQIFFDGRIQKMTSVLASIATAAFNNILPLAFPKKIDLLPMFDCRVWQVPTKEEAINNILWRELDATKNSISMAARHYYSHKELSKKNSSEMQEMLFQKGINWNDYPSHFKRGTYVQRRKIIKKFSTQEINKLPLKHEARTNPNLEIERTEVRYLDMPPLSKVINKVGVIIYGEEPIIKKED